MTDPTRGLLDTSVVIDHDVIDPKLLPDQSAIAAITLAELAAGPHATTLHWVRNNGEVQIEDLGSYNGIRVNNARIAERVSLRVSDQVQGRPGPRV